MRNTEEAEQMFSGAANYFNWMGGDPRNASAADLQRWLAGMRSLAMGLVDLSLAVRDIYDKLDRMRPRITGTIERIPPR